MICGICKLDKPTVKKQEIIFRGMKGDKDISMNMCPECRVKAEQRLRNL
jgi:hypothetical protein